MYGTPEPRQRPSEDPRFTNLDKVSEIRFTRWHVRQIALTRSGQATCWSISSITIARAVIDDWVKALKPNGILKIAVPDFARYVKPTKREVIQTLQAMW